MSRELVESKHVRFHEVAMSLEHHWSVEAFAGQLRAAHAGLDLTYAGNGHWSASSTGAAGDISLRTPEGTSWPRLERLMRVLVGAGLVQARVIFRGMPPVFDSASTASSAMAGSTSGPVQYAKIIAFSERTKSFGATLDLNLGSDGLWYVHAADAAGRYSLTPSFGEGWGRLEGLLQVLAAAGLSEANVSFEGLPPKLAGGAGHSPTDDRR